MARTSASEQHGPVRILFKVAMNTVITPPARPQGSELTIIFRDSKKLSTISITHLKKVTFCPAYQLVTVCLHGDIFSGDHG